jgi:uncharacterized membrane protein
MSKADSDTTRHAAEVRKEIDVSAPVGEVFGFWTDYENFPRVMKEVREVRDTGNGRSHWVVSGPAGVLLEWDAVITRLVPNELFAWRSAEGSAVEQAGVVRFEPNADGTATRVRIRFSYNPPAGAVGQALAALLGADPEKKVDEALMRIKTFIEAGSPRRDAAQTTRGRGE